VGKQPKETFVKIGIVSDDGKTIAGHLGRARGFIIYEVENGAVTKKSYLDNTFTGHTGHRHGEGHTDDCGGEHHGEHHGHGPVLQALAGCDAVISRGMGRRIYADLNAAGISAYVVDETDADRALELYLKEALVDRPDKSCDH
jgi:predicted Fe-Mo cluster-binding NifX family protein